MVKTWQRQGAQMKKSSLCDTETAVLVDQVTVGKHVLSVPFTYSSSGVRTLGVSAFTMQHYAQLSRLKRSDFRLFPVPKCDI